jgi:hypothetical protein
MADVHHLAKNAAGAFVWRFNFRGMSLIKKPLYSVSWLMMTYK